MRFYRLPQQTWTPEHVYVPMFECYSSTRSREEHVLVGHMGISTLFRQPRTCMIVVFAKHAQPG